MRRGKFIVFYGINLLGKSTQAKILVGNIRSLGKRVEYLKYPIYGLEPDGKLVNAYLRLGNPYKLSAMEFQTLTAFNRQHFEPELLKKLETNTSIVAEDYTGTETNLLIKFINKV